MAQDSKTCTRCGEQKPLDEYSRNKRFKDGRERRCKACRSELYAVWRVDNLDRRREYQQAWYRRHPGAKSRHDRDYHARNAERNRAKVKAWRLANDERYREAYRAWRASHPENIAHHSRARRSREKFAPGHATVEQVLARVDYFGGCCWMCGAPWEHIDHVKPLSKGGSQWASNLRPACASCNLAKSDTWPLTRAA